MKADKFEDKMGNREVEFLLRIGHSLTTLSRVVVSQYQEATTLTTQKIFYLQEAIIPNHLKNR